MRRAALVPVLLVLVGSGTPARAATPLRAGSLDLSFGTRGSAQIPGVGEVGDRLLSDARGRLLVVTSDSSGFEVRRFDADGRPDRRFGRAGIARVSPAARDGNARIGLAAVLPDGRIVVAGPTRGDAVAAVRLLDDGTPDPGFAQGGLWERTLFATGSAFALRPGGGLAVAGAAVRSGGPFSTGGLLREPLLLVLGPDGRPDPAAGPSGQIALDDATGYVVALRSDAAGYLLLGAPPSSAGGLATTRLSPSGAVVSRSTTTVAEDRAFGLLLDGDRVISSTSDGLAASRLGGGPLASFGTRGQVRLRGRDRGFVAGLAVDPQGRLLVGTIRTSERRGTLTSAVRPLRRRADGAPDPSFTAPLTALPPDQRAETQSIATDPSGRVLLLTTGSGQFERDDIREPGSTILRYRTRPPLARLTAASFAVRRSGLLTLRVRCAGPPSCRGTVRLGGRTASFQAAGRRTTTVRVRLARTRRPSTSHATSVLRVRSGGRTDAVGEAIRLVRR